MLRVLEIQADDPWGGAASHVVTLSNALQTLCEVAIVSPPGGLLTVAACPVIPWNKGESLQNILAAHPTDIVHLHGGRAGKEGWLALRGSSQPVVYTEHLWTKAYHLANPVREWVQLLGLRFVAARADAIITPSDAVANFLISRHLAQPEKIHRISHGVPRRPACKLTSSLTIGMVGSLNRTKRYELAFESLARLPEELPWRLVVYGSGELRQALERRANELRIESRISWQENLREVDWCSFAVFLQTSASESFGLAVAEAMSAGIPTVVTDTGALPDLVGNAGIVVSSDSRSIAAALIALLTDQKRRQVLGQAGRKHIEECHSVKRMAEATAEVYRVVYETNAH